MTNHKLNRRRGRFPYWDGSDVRVSASQADEGYVGAWAAEDQDAYDSTAECEPKPWLCRVMSRIL